MNDDRTELVSCLLTFSNNVAKRQKYNMMQNPDERSNKQGGCAKEELWLFHSVEYPMSQMILYFSSFRRQISIHLHRIKRTIRLPRRCLLQRHSQDILSHSLLLRYHLFLQRRLLCPSKRPPPRKSESDSLNRIPLKKTSFIRS